jgi:hypothetical protein
MMLSFVCLEQILGIWFTATGRFTATGGFTSAGRAIHVGIRRETLRASVCGAILA